eukprot:TRINITY_DN1997_c0_g1_i4.p1 TRINITY_DN1997_c0_g1~~TRINITY_DN1997_c0_g1_i4.p1  ORF type:complete len:353 (+),score=94.68 TRINITY_DN1997_c0_g1_i4:129-1187(+)
MGSVCSKDGATNVKEPVKSKDEPKQKVDVESKEPIDPRSSSESFQLVDPNSIAKGKVEDHYVVEGELGRGTFSIVYEATHKETGKKYALKFIDKKFVDKEDLVLLSREIDIMKKVDHPNVLSLKELFETPTQLSLVLELVKGGELFFKIVERGSYSEQDASAIVRQIVNGVLYLHSLGIAHRDLKPENVLVAIEDGEEVIKIADFGLSKVFAGGQNLVTSCGTPDYAAPEVLTCERAYDKSVDLWSVGVITYVLLCGYPPFYANSHPALFEKIIHCNYSFPEPEWNLISGTAKDFIKNLLVINPKLRMTAQMSLDHPFLKGGAGTNEISTNSMSSYNLQRKKIQQQYVSSQM